jgi:hypothetical protein
MLLFPLLFQRQTFTVASCFVSREDPNFCFLINLRAYICPVDLIGHWTGKVMMNKYSSAGMCDEDGGVLTSFGL